MSEEVPEEVLEPRGEEGRFAATWQNKAAGRALRAARQGAKQAEFAATLSQELGVTISTTALSGWETGRRQVPAPVWMAAAMAAQQSLDALVAESGAPEAVAWAEGLGLPQRMESQAADIRELKAELAALRQQYADFQTQAAMATQQPLDALVAESGTPEPAARAQRPSLPQRMESQAADIRDLKAELVALRQQYADFQTQVINTLARAGVAFTARSDRQTGRGGPAVREERQSAG
jgi:ribosomal protein L29